MSPLIRTRLLAREMRALRGKVSTTELASKISKSRAAISELETANGRPNVSDVTEILDALGVTEPKWREMVQMATEAATPGWWEDYQPHIGARQAIYANLESGASEVCEYQNFVVPGLLQIPEFTHARIQWSKTAGTLSPRTDIGRQAAARRMRQRMLFGDGGPSYEAILEDVAIRRRAAPAQVMAAQLRHLATLAEENRISIRILPVDAEIADNWLPRSSFSHYRYGDPTAPRVVAVDTEHTDLVYIDPEHVDPYLGVFRRIRDAALSVEDSVATLKMAARRFSERTEKS